MSNKSFSKACGISACNYEIGSVECLEFYEVNLKVVICYCLGNAASYGAADSSVKRAGKSQLLQDDAPSGCNEILKPL
ncbi:hypothetical protein KUF54_12490 [Comamonas sp. Y33R10-2]|uniref:hypothetical protein n=1 Tax=Comamonas sp. Y33R10-2 TaxID=2853257 RepID=UPI001C5CC17F|nr:hypothetical protein [Comamonas sp. Y33R10-2]QXZ08867.1 hypothetical protein KUF54_12490 [Comamonas sp. Y33R10-2]